MRDFRLLIDGRLVSGDAASEVVNPATEAAIALCPRASMRQLDAAVAAAKAAFPAWSQRPAVERAAVLIRIADALDAEAEPLGRLLTQEQGRPLAEATGEVRTAAAFFRRFAALAPPPPLIHDSADRRVEIHRMPLGVVGAITPWNVPLVLMAFKVPLALLAGNTVVLKPAPTTPLTTLRFGELVADIVPPGVINVIADANDLGAALTAHPDVAKISFTGSTATGAKVMAGAAPGLKRVTLELGGNDAAIVLDDVDPKIVAPKLFQAAFRNNGQVCIAIKRLYVHEAVYDAVCGELARLADQAVVGDGLDLATQLGPLQNKAQFDKVTALIADAAACGAVIAGGPSAPTAGYFIRPTIVRDIEDGARLVDEEQFGPALPVIRFSDPEDAITRANASPLGLGGSVWSADIERATALARRLQVGTAWVNKHADLTPDIPFAGAKQSGLGVELGDEGLAEFTQLKVVNVALQ